MNGKFNPRLNQGLFSKIIALFSIFEKRWERPPPLPLFARLSVWLNMHQYSWIPLIVLGNAWINCSDYVRAQNISDHLTSSTGFLRFLGFWIRYDCICKSYTESWICLHMAQCTSIMPEYASVCLNVPQYVWPRLNIAKCPWICLNKLLWPCQGYQYASSS